MTAPSRFFGILAFALVVLSTLVVFSGIDLMLPAVPDFPRLFKTDIATAQLVLAAYTFGSGIGLLMFGALGAKYDRCMLLYTSLAVFALAAYACTFATNIYAMIGLRVLQGVSSAASGVFAPSIIRVVFDEKNTVRAIGLMGSIESLMPALAPIAGAWLLVHYGWQSSFDVTAALAILVAMTLFTLRNRLPMGAQMVGKGSYRALMTNLPFLRYAISHACSLGGLVAFVFGAPAVIVNTMGGTLADFIVMQVFGIAVFITAANTSGHMTPHFGAEKIIWFGTSVAAFGALAILVYALAGGNDPHTMTALMIAVNFGFGMRGPTGYFSAIQAAGGDDTRGSALTILAILMAIAGGTVVAAPFLEHGLWALAAVCVGIHALALLVLALVPARAK